MNPYTENTIPEKENVKKKHPMTYRKNLILTILAVGCLIISILSGYRVYLMAGVYLPGHTQAYVACADSNHIYGYDSLYVVDDNGSRHGFWYYYQGEASGLKSGTEVLVSGQIVYTSESMEPGTNADLLIVSKQNACLSLIGLCVAVVATVALSVIIILNWHKKPWNSSEEAYTKETISIGFLTAEFLLLAAAVVMIGIGLGESARYLPAPYKTSGEVIVVTGTRADPPSVKRLDNGSILYRMDYHILIRLDEPYEGEEDYVIVRTGYYAPVFEGAHVLVGIYNQKKGSYVSYGAIYLMIIGIVFLVFHYISARIIYAIKKDPTKIRFMWFM